MSPLLRPYDGVRRTTSTARPVRSARGRTCGANCRTTPKCRPRRSRRDRRRNRLRRPDRLHDRCGARAHETRPRRVAGSTGRRRESVVRGARAATWNDRSRLGSTIADTLTVIASPRSSRSCSHAGSAGARLVPCHRVFLEVTVFVSTTFLVDRERPPVVQPGRGAADVELPLGPHRRCARAVPRDRLDPRRPYPEPFLRVLVFVLSSLAPLGVALSRVYRGMHFPSDVAAGAALGVACLAVRSSPFVSPSRCRSARRSRT